MIRQAVQLEMANFRHNTYALSYRLHRVDRKEDSVRQVIETADGNVARTIRKNGRELTPTEDAAETARLLALSPADLHKHRTDDRKSDEYSTELISAMPDAMLYTLTPDQPQLPSSTTEAVVLDFSPNPAYHATSTTTGLLAGIAGRMWIDQETHRLLRIEITITHDLNLFFGILARVYSGGHVAFQQAPIGDGHYGFTHISIDVRLRELMVKTVPYKSTLDASDIVILPAAPPLDEAVRTLTAGSH